jgi:uncharacterized phiE125 gp8 family phage protein
MRYNDVIGPPQVTTDVASLAAEPVTLVQVKRHLSLQFDTSGSYQFDDDDTKLEELIVQSREFLEQFTGLSMASKTYKAILRNECGGIEIPYGPITSITSVKDIDGNVLINGTSYQLKGNQFYEIVSPASCYIEVVYVSGYTPTNIPAGLKRALLEQIAFNYVNAGDQQQSLCNSAMEKAAPYSRKSLIA